MIERSELCERVLLSYQRPRDFRHPASCACRWGWQIQRMVKAKVMQVLAWPTPCEDRCSDPPEAAEVETS